MKNKKMIIKGSGNMTAVNPLNNKEILTLGKLQDLRITFTTEIDDIFGGDSLYPIDTLVRSKSIEISATNAKFDLNQMKLMLGNSCGVNANGNDDNYIHVLDEFHIVPATGATEVTLDNAAGDLFDTNFHVRCDDDNMPISLGDPLTEDYEYSLVDNVLTFSAAMAGKKVYINYRINETMDENSMYAVLKDEVPFNVSIVHQGSFRQKDNTLQGIETEIYSCRARGSFTIDAARTTASTSAIELTIVDPERPDGRLGTVKRFELTNKGCAM